MWFALEKVNLGVVAKNPPVYWCVFMEETQRHKEKFMSEISTQTHTIQRRALFFQGKDDKAPETSCKAQWE